MCDAVEQQLLRKGKGQAMTRTGTFITSKELEALRTEQRCSGMFLSGGMPMGNPAREVERLRNKYEMPDGYGLDLGNGEFVKP